MKDEIHIKIKWNWGGDKIVKAKPSDILGDVLKQNSFIPLDTCALIIISNGKILRPDLSIGFQNIKNDNLIVLVQKKLPDQTKKQRFLDSLSTKPTKQQIHLITINNFDQLKFEQVAKMNDLAFAAWENSTEFPNLLNDLHKSQIFEDNQFNNSLENITIIPESPSEISTRPLPPLLENEDITHLGFSRNGFKLSTGFISDQRKSEFLGDVKKQ